MDLFKTAVISLFVVALLGIISVSVTAHSEGNYTENNSNTENPEETFFGMKKMHKTMHKGNFEEFHEQMLGENWKEEINEMHETMDSEDFKEMQKAMESGNFEEMTEHCPMMSGKYI